MCKVRACPFSGEGLCRGHQAAESEPRLFEQPALVWGFWTEEDADLLGFTLARTGYRRPRRQQDRVGALLASIGWPGEGGSREAKTDGVAILELV